MSVNMENGTQAQFRGTKRKKKKTLHQLVLSFYFFSCKRSLFLFKLAQNQVKSQKVCHVNTGYNTDQSDINLTSTETLAGSGKSCKVPLVHNFHVLRPKVEMELLQKH